MDTKNLVPKVGLLGNCGYSDLHNLTGGVVLSSLPQAMKMNIIIATGGDDIEPSLYHQEKKPWCEYTDPKRDAFEREVLLNAIEKHIRILGICRGHQLINAILGGSLYQDISIECGFNHRSNSKVIDMSQGGVDKFVHDFRPDEKDFWQLDSMALTFPYLNSYHHQAVEKIGSGQRVLCTARDGIIEATCNDDFHIVTFQFHPEWFDRGVPYFEHVMDTGSLVW